MSACRRFETAARDGDPLSSRELETHAQACASCRQEMASWKSISQEAPALRKSWESPDLWPRIEKAVSGEIARRKSSPEALAVPAPARRPWIPLAAAATLFIVATIGLQVFRPNLGEHEPYAAHNDRDPLLSEQALSEVEQSERRYVESIERLSRLAEPRWKEPATPLRVAYRERLQLLDGAIADLKSQLDQNRFNTHLRRELLAMYQEKQHTLEQVVGEGKS